MLANAKLHRNFQRPALFAKGVTAALCIDIDRVILTAGYWRHSYWQGTNGGFRGGVRYDIVPDIKMK